jgi:hypothetical protein
VDTFGGALKVELRCKESKPDAEAVSCGDQTPEKIAKEQRLIAEGTLAEARGE